MGSTTTTGGEVLKDISHLQSCPRYVRSSVIIRRKGLWGTVEGVVFLQVVVLVKCHSQVLEGTYTVFIIIITIIREKGTKITINRIFTKKFGRIDLGLVPMSCICLPGLLKTNFAESDQMSRRKGDGGPSR